MKKTILFLLVSFSTITLCYAQRHNIDSISTRYCFYFPVPSLVQVPPLYTDMSYSILIGYVAADSIFRSVAQWQIDSLLNCIHSYDSIRYLLKYIYLMKDYNPSLYMQYTWYANLIDTLYKCNLGYAESQLFNRLSAIDISHLKKPQALVAKASGIFLISISNINRDSELIGFFGDYNIKEPLNCITATMVQQIKGNHWPSCLDNNISFKHPQKHFIQSSSDRCLQFTCNLYTPLVMPIGDSPGIDTLHRRIIADNGTFAKNYGDINWAAGNEYIVFLNIDPEYYDGVSDNFIINPQSNMDPQGGVYPVINGMVQDSTNFFGVGTSVPLSHFINGLNTIISEITQQ